MDVLVMLEEHPEHSPVLAHVNSVPQPLQSERPTRDVVTLYGDPSPELLALALAAAVESHRSADESSDTIRHLALWAERGAVGDAAWRDLGTGQLITRDLDIPLDVLYDDEHLIVINKPANMIVHPGRGNYLGTLAGAWTSRVSTESTSAGGSASRASRA